MEHIPLTRIAFALLFSLVISFSCTKKNSIVVVSKNFNEQVLLGELIAQQIERVLNVPVVRKLNLGGTFVCHKAIVSGEADIYVEYTGTALTAILKKDPFNDPARVYEEVRDSYRSQFQLEWTEPLGFNNTFAIIIRGEDARRNQIKSLSQAVAFAPQWKPGFGYEFVQREDGFPGLVKAYGLKFAEAPRIMDLSLTYKAVAEKQVDLIAGNSTDGLITKLDLFVLEDDRKYFPPYEAAPVVRQDTIQKHPGLREALQKLGGTISDDMMRSMNQKVAVEHQDITKVASDFLQSLK